MGSYNHKKKRRALSCIFSNLSEFRFPQNIQETGQYEKLDEIKDLYIAIPQSVFKHFPIIFMAFIWVDALEHKFEIWVLYCRFLSKDRYRRPAKPIKRNALKFIRICVHIVIIKPRKLLDERLFRVNFLMYRYSCFHSRGDYRLHIVTNHAVNIGIK